MIKVVRGIGKIMVSIGLGFGIAIYSVVILPLVVSKIVWDWLIRKKAK